jgi:hypothetical protein
MNDKKPTYRVEIKNSGTPPNEAYGWKMYYPSYDHSNSLALAWRD